MSFLSIIPVMGALLVTAGNTVVIIICFAAFAACLALVNQERRYRHESENLRNARERWEASTSGEEADSGLHRDSMVGLFADAIVNQLSVGEASELAQRTDEAHASTVWANTLLSLLLIAGLAGTLFAFKDALGEPPNTGKNGGIINVDAIQKYTIGVYSGIRGAFLPSVVGILSTILLYFYRGVCVQPKRDLFFVELENFGHRLARAANSTPPTNELALIAASQKISDAATKIEAAASEVKSAFQGAAEIGLKLNEATKNLQAAATQLEPSATSFLKAFDGSKSPVAMRLGTLATAIERFEKGSERDRGALAENSAGIKQVVDVVHSHVESISMVIARLEGIIKEHQAGATKLDDVVKNFGEGINLQQTAIAQTAQKLGAAIETQARQAGEAMSQMKASLTAVQHEIVSAITTAGQQQSSILDSTSNALAEAGRGIGATAERVVGVTEVLASSMTGLSNLPASLEHLPALNEQLRQTLRELQSGAAAASRQLALVANQMAAGAFANAPTIVKQGKMAWLVGKLGFWKRDK
jgi:hypothetical protein